MSHDGSRNTNEYGNENVTRQETPGTAPSPDNVSIRDIKKNLDIRTAADSEDKRESSGKSEIYFYRPSRPERRADTSGAAPASAKKDTAVALEDPEQYLIEALEGVEPYRIAAQAETPEFGPDNINSGSGIHIQGGHNSSGDSSSRVNDNSSGSRSSKHSSGSHDHSHHGSRSARSSRTGSHRSSDAMASSVPKRTPPAPDDPTLARMNRELDAILGAEIKGDGKRKQRTESQMKALQKERVKKRISIPLILLCVIVILAGGAFGGYQYLKASGRRSLLTHEQVEGVEITAPEAAVLEDEGDKVTYNGKTYHRNKDIISILALGVDIKSENPEEREIGNNGQADTIFIAALNTVTGKMDLINISRDSIADVDLYDTNGNFADTEEMQICLAYAYGDGGKTSCENMIKSVSRLMYGMPIDAYASITVPAISVLNDAIGGVEVTVLDDLGSGENRLVKGEKVRLMGKQVNTYVISRDQYDTDANNGRMARQRQYLIGFLNQAFRQIRSSLTTVFTLYEAVTSYMTTDLTVAKMTYLASLAMDGKFREQDIRTVPGEVVLGTSVDGGEHAEYHVNDEELYQIILDVYYTEE